MQGHSPLDATSAATVPQRQPGNSFQMEYRQRFALRSREVLMRAAIAGVLSGAAAAHAQSSVTLYGVVDTFVTNIHADGKPSVTRMDSSGLYASRWGVRGSEDLGGGNKTNFVLESGINSNDGSQADSNRLFNRQAWVGLSNNRYGEVRLGRQNTPEFLMSGRFDAFFAATQASGWNNMSTATVRIDNAVGYFSPTVAGFKFSGLYARGAVSGGTPLSQDQSNQNFHIALEYEKGPVYFGVNHEEVRNGTLPYIFKRTSGGGTYTLDKHWQFFFAANDDKTTDDSVHTNVLSASLAYSFTVASRLALGYTYMIDHVSGTGHGNASQLGVMYSYALSKRTMLYSTYSRLSQQGSRNNLALNGAAVVEPSAHITSGPGGTINGVQLGIVHFF
ncbi:putative porin [Paraburkholderia caballeronis]|nr:putative porin [Paraburkholderia caballeronis]TDV18806.1 putative porin [Paraburkholderia caballeronis]TDV26939.1 putative porin [Paraburkholderia caballeronis]